MSQNLISFSFPSNRIKNLKRVVIPVIEEDFVFNYTLYPPSIHEIISRREFNQILDKANLILSYSKIKKRSYDHLKVPKWLYLLSVLSCIFILLFLFFLYFSPRINNNGKNLYATGVAFCLLGTFIIIGIEIYNVIRKITKNKTIEEFIYEDIKPFFDEKNTIYYPYLNFSFNQKNRTIELTYEDQGKGTWGNNESEKRIIENDFLETPSNFIDFSSPRVSPENSRKIPPKKRKRNSVFQIAPKWDEYEENKWKKD